MAARVGSDIVENGLVLALDAADKLSYPGSGTAWYDLSGNSNTGTLTNGPTFSAANMGSIVFDGVNDYVDCGTGSTLNNLPAISICCWLSKTNVSSAGIFDRIVAKRNLSQNGWWDFYTGPDNIIGVTVDYTTTDLSRETSVSISLNTDVMVGVTWDGSSTGTNIKFYINANETTYQNTINGVGSRPTETTNNLYVGNANYAVRPFKGKIYNVMIYNRVLTASEILQNYNANKSRFGL